MPIHNPHPAWLRRLLCGLALIALLVSFLHPPSAAVAAPARAIYCSSYYFAPEHWMRVVAEVYDPAAQNWDIYSVIPCMPDAGRTRLTTGPAYDGEARLSPDGAWIAFVSERDGNPEIYRMDFDGANPTRLTDQPAADSAPAISPDGTRIAFVSERDGSPEIYVMNADGSGLARLTENDLPDLDPDWSPDGSRLAWVQGLETGRQVWVMGLDGSQPAALGGERVNARRPRWSPLGDRLALEADDNLDGWQDLLQISADGTGQLVVPLPKTVSATQGTDFVLGGWYPAGNGLVYASETYTLVSGQFKLSAAQLMVTSLTGGTTTMDNATEPSTLPDTRPLDPYPPVTALNDLPTYTRPNQSLNWTASDPGRAGLESVTIDYQVQPGGAWETSALNCYYEVKTTANDWSGRCLINGLAGQTVRFRVRAKDLAGNLTLNPAEVQTTLFGWLAQGRVTDTRGISLAGVQIDAGPGMMGTAQTDAQGEAVLHFTSVNSAAVQFSRAGYAQYPPQTWPLNGDVAFQAVLPPLDNVLANGDFEHPELILSGWQTGGELPVTPVDGLSGSSAARLGQGCDDHLCLAPLERMYNSAYTFGQQLAVDADGTLHLLFSVHEKLGLYEITRPRGGSWSAPVFLSNVQQPSRIASGPDRTLYYLYRTVATRLDSLAIKPPSGDWTYETIPALNTSTYGYTFTVDPHNQLHLVYEHTDGLVRYLRREADGAWAGPFVLDGLKSRQADGSLLKLAAGPDGTLHLVYVPSIMSFPYTPKYAQISPTGELLNRETLPSSYVYYQGVAKLDDLQASANGELHLLAQPSTQQTPYPNPYYWLRGADGTWQAPLAIGLDASSDPVMVAGPRGEVHLFAAMSYGGAYYLFKAPQSNTFSKWSTQLRGLRVDSITPALDDAGQLMLALPEDYEKNLYFTRITPPGAGTAELRQSVTIPASLNAPTLSFRYRLDQEFGGPASGLTVTVQPAGGDETPVYTSPGARSGWQHGWADLSAYAGQPVTLVFRLNQAAGEWYARLTLDEISLGSWNPSVIQSIAPGALSPQQAAVTPLRLRGLNLGEGGQVYLGDTPALSVTADPLTGDLLAGLPPEVLPGTYPVSIRYPDGREARAPQPLRIHIPIYLPTLRQ